MTTRKRTRPARVLLVDDNPGDLFMMREALEETGSPIECILAADGQEALEHLQAAADTDGLPDLMIVDLNMPGVDGFEVLRAVRETAEWAHVPVVVMTSSTAKSDVLEAYRKHASSYVEKPMTADAFFETMQGLERYWLGLARLPSDD